MPDSSRFNASRDASIWAALPLRLNQDTRIVFLANPNNPTGTLVTVDEVDQFLDKIPEHVVVVLDEAYYEFAADFAKQRGVMYSRSLEYVRRDVTL